MNIEIKKEESKIFYDEILYIMSKYKKIKSNPRQKVHRLTYYLLAYELIILVCMILYAILGFTDGKTIDMIIIGMLTTIFIFIFFYIIFINKQIKDFIKNENYEKLRIDEDGIELISKDKNITNKWNTIENIIINKYSICFLSKQMTGVFIFVSVEYKNDIIKGLEEYNYNSLLVDNSKMYK